ncbi:CBBY-like protein isoform X2 [Ziziphus jujuba]|uniref:CBBY-like protein isoform X2 n=1 Tax=Ziziphus jujuba TaxID=326968 RepID=A0ABM3IKM9_ZIZJJ|nr:CBBY-like protein isoform X2 [Ziziphus jujuba]
MASTTISLSLATISSSKALLSHPKPTSIYTFKAYERTFSSSLLGTSLSIETARPRPICRGTASSSSNGVTCSSSSSPLPSALLFDCDGVLVDTEKDGHRVSFNDTFKEKDLGTTWDVDLYGELLKIGGGKERMTAYFNKTGWPEKAPKGEEERKQFIASLHKRKTELFMALIEKKLLPLRPGVAKLIDQALSKGVKVAVCSTSNEKAAIYTLAASTLGVDPLSCVVIEDSGIGLAAAKAAGMKCIVTKSGYTANEDFLNADAVFDFIGDPPEERFDLAFCGSLLEKQYVS